MTDNPHQAVESTSVMPEPPTTIVSTDVPTFPIPIFEPTTTATSVLSETIAVIPTTKKVKTPVSTKVQDKNKVCPNALPTRLEMNIYVYLIPDPPIPNRVRIGPGASFAAKGLVKPGEVMRILSGPICSGNSIWWKIDVKFSDLVGWVAEADAEQYWLAPCPTEGHCPPLP